MTSKTLFSLAAAGCLLAAATQTGRAQIAATISEISADTPPIPGAYDASQLLYSSATGNPGGLNYYWDNSNPNGSTFATGNNSGGYVLDSVTIKTLGGGGSDGSGGITFYQPYNLYIYAVVTNATSTNGTLLAFYQSQGFSFYTQTDWLQMSGLNLPLLPNTRYAYTFSRTVASYENLGFSSGIPAAVGQTCEIPTGGGAINFGNDLTSGNCGTFDIGLSLPSALSVAAPTSSQSPVAAGTSFTLSAGTVVDNAGNGTYTYQWQTDGGSGGTVTNIPGAANPTLLVNTSTNNLGNFQYDVLVTDSTSASAVSMPLVVDVNQVLSGAFADIGAAAPTPGAYDADQLLVTDWPQTHDKINYYTDTPTPVGQTFTTGDNPKGYGMTSVALGLNASNGGYSGNTTPQAYDLRIYQISADNTTAILLYDVTNLNASYTAQDWVQWTFPQIALSPDTMYAYTFHKSANNNVSNSYGAMGTDAYWNGDAYTGGQVCAIPVAGGPVTYSGDIAADAAFDVGMIPLGISIVVNAGSATPNPVYALGPVVLQDTVLLPVAGSFTYQWLTDDGTGVTPPNYITIPGATSTNLTATLKNLNPGGADYTTNYYFVAYVGASSATSAPVTLTVHAASAPLFTTVPANLVTYAGSSQSITVTENGTFPITNQWQFNDVNNDGFGSLPLQTNTTLTLNNLLPINSGTYQVAATNKVGSNISTPIALTVLPIPDAPIAASQKYYEAIYTNNAWAYWRLNETNDPNVNDYISAPQTNPPVVRAYDYSGHGFLATYGNQMTVNNAGPSSLTPGFPGFDTGELAAGTERNSDNGYLTVPNLNLSGNTNLTFIVWINPSITPPGSGGLLFNRSAGDANTCGFGFAGDGAHLGYTWNNNSSATYNYVPSMPAVGVGEWNFVAYVITPTNTIFYLGNLDGGTTNFSFDINPVPNIGQTWSGGVIRLGDDQNSYTRSFPGLISEAALFTNSLTADQIQQLFLTGIGARGLVPNVGSTTVNPSVAQVYSGQNVILSANYVGTGPLSAQWQASPDTVTWTNIPGATNSTVVVNPVVPPGGALYCYQLKVSNSIGSTTNAAVYMNYADLPLTPPGLWTANFQETNNIGANQSIGGGLGHYVGRGILGSGMYWNVLPHILTSVNPWNSANVTNVTDLRDDGVTHSGITCVMNNGGSYNSYGGSLANTSDIRNLLDQYMRNYNPNNGQNVLQFFNVPDGTYNLVCYGGNGATSQGADNYGTTFVVHDPVNGDQTNSTSEPTFQTDALTEGVNFVTFTNVHVAGGTVSVDVRPNFVADPSAGSGGCIEAAQIQLVHYDPLVAAFNGGPASISAGQTAIFTNTSTGFVTNSVWTFGDGFSVTNSSNASVSHSYTNVGTYTVSLTVSGPGGLPSSVTQAGYIVVTAPPTAPSIGSAKLANGSLVFSGSGTAGQPYRVLTSTNLTLPMASWIPVWTNTVTADGSYSYTNSSLTNAGSFFRLVTP